VHAKLCQQLLLVHCYGLVRGLISRSVIRAVSCAAAVVFVLFMFKGGATSSFIAADCSSCQSILELKHSY
jgi:hypothetical protein